VYVRTVNGEETTFGTSGALWRDALVMYDRSTETLWSQVNATAISGEHTGDVLVEIPSVVTTWGEWKALHPDTLVLEKPPLDGSPYDRYFSSAEAYGASGEGSDDDRLPGKDLVIGVFAQGAAAAVSLAQLQKTGVINGQAGTLPVVWIALGKEAVAAFDRRVEGRTLHLVRDGAGVVTAEDSTFDALTGKFTTGPLAGGSLPNLSARRAYWYSWTLFHPETALVESDSK
jgi:hypothetical protein